MKARTKKRLALLAGLALVLVAGALVLNRVRAQQRTAAIQQARENGIAAHEAGNHQQAIEHLATYLNAGRAEPNILISYAESLREVPDPNGRNLAAAVRVARMVADEEQDVGPGKELLLDLYPAVGRITELEQLTANILETHPDHRRAGILRVQALVRLDREEQALALAERLATEHPQDAPLQSLYFSTAARAEIDNERVIERATALANNAGLSPAARLIGARALATLGRPRHAANIVRDALNADQSLNASTLRTAASLADALAATDPNLIGTIRAALIRALADADRSDLRAFALERAWKRGDGTLIAAILSRLDEQQLDALSSNELGLLALLETEATAEQDRNIVPGGLETIRDELNNRAASTHDNNNAPDTWLELLDIVQATGQSDAAQARRTLADIAAANDGLASAVAAFYLGLVLDRIGETDTAAEQLNTLAQRPDWRRARLALAAVEHARNRHAHAAAVLLSEPTIESWPVGLRLLVDAVVEYTAQDDVLDEAREFANQLTEDYLRVNQNDPESAALRARALLAAGNTADARQVTQQLLDIGPEDDRTTFRLAEELADTAPELSTQLRDAIAASDRGELRLELDRARTLARDGLPEEALRILDDAQERLRTQQGRARLAVARAQLLERFDTDRARHAFLDASERYPDDAAVQRAALQSSTLWQPPIEVAPAIDRLRAITGERAVDWRTHDARRILATDTSQAAASNALITLNDVLRARPQNLRALTLAAEAAERLGDAEAAVTYLERALETNAAPPTVHARLIALLERTGQPTEARRRLLAFRDINIDDPALQRERATMLTRAGLNEDARQQWQRLAASNNPTDLVGLAAATLRSGQSAQRAAELLKQAFSPDQSPTPSTRIRGARLLRTLGNRDQGLAVLRELPVSGEWGNRDAVIGNYLLDAGQPQAAIQHLASAANQHPADTETIANLVRAHLALGNIDDARTAVQQALDDAPQDPVLIATQRALNNQHPSPPLLLRIASERAAMRAATNNTLDRTATSIDAHLAGDTNLDQFRDELGAALQSEPAGYRLWRLLADAHAAAPDPRQAAQTMRQAALALPGHPDAARDAALLSLQTGQLDDAAALARRWAELDPASALAADTLRGRALLAAGDPASAARVLAAAKQHARDDNHDTTALDRTLFIALAAANRTQQASQLLAADDHDHTAWTNALIEAATLTEDTSAARRWLQRAETNIDTNAPPPSLVYAQYALAERTGSREDFQRILELTDAQDRTQRSPEALTLRGVAFRKLGKDDDAIRAYRAALQRGATSPDLLNNLAHLLVETHRDPTEAVALARRAVDAARELGADRERLRNYLDTLGLAELHAENPTAAERAFRDAADISPDDPRLQIGLAEALLAQGDDEAADRIAQRPLRHDELPPDLVDRLESLRLRLDERNQSAQR